MLFLRKNFFQYTPFYMMEEGTDARPPLHTVVAYLASDKC